MSSNFLEQLKPYVKEIQQELRQSVKRFSPGPPELDTMIAYHLGWVDQDGSSITPHSGKQIRPALVVMAAKLAGGDWRQALPAAAAIELLHNFSLIHDDIEDNSPLRRGRPALWSIWGIPSAINAGDTMFALAHRVLLRLSELGVPSERVLQAVELFEQTNLELTRGQHLDMGFEHQETVTVDSYLDMISGKSAALIAASAKMGALIAGQSDEIADHYAQFGQNLGMAFQIQDDILGIWGDPDVTGKSAATDIVSRKKSLPVLYGLANSPVLVDLYHHEMATDESVSKAVEALNQVRALDFARNYAQQYSETALASLQVMVDCGDAEMGLAFSGLVSFLLGRNL